VNGVLKAWRSEGAESDSELARRLCERPPSRLPGGTEANLEGVLNELDELALSREFTDGTTTPGLGMVGGGSATWQEAMAPSTAARNCAGKVSGDRARSLRAWKKPLSTRKTGENGEDDDNEEENGGGYCE
jgi:hypothetical protein